MPDDLAASLGRIMASGDVLEPWQRAAVGGKTAQLRMPLHDKHDLRRVAAILAHLAGELDHLSRQRTDNDFHALSQARTAAKAAQARLARKYERERPME